MIKAIWKKGKGAFQADGVQAVAENIFILSNTNNESCCTNTPEESTTPLPNVILSGSDLIWVEGYTFRVPPHSYRIGGVVYNTDALTITLDAADGALNRSDTIIGTINSAGEGLIEILKGELGTPAVQRTINTDTQIEITVIDIDAGSTAPSSISTEILYDENTESVNTGDANFNSIVNPYSNTKCIQTTDFTTGNSIELKKTFNLDLYDLFQFHIASTSDRWENLGTIRIAFFNGIVRAGDWVSIGERTVYNFDTTNKDWQIIGVPKSAFNFRTNEITKLVIEKVDGKGTDSWKMDLLRFQAGLTPPFVENTHLSQFINDLEDVTRIIKHPLNNDPLLKKTIEPFDKVENLWLPDNETLIEAGVFTGTDIYNLTHYRQDDLITNIIIHS